MNHLHPYVLERLGKDLSADRLREARRHHRAGGLRDWLRKRVRGRGSQ